MIVEGPGNIGYKRNLACGQAAGEFIAHWDDDDWSAPNRLTTQYEQLLYVPEAAVTGYRALLFFDMRTGEQWVYSGVTTFVAGTSLFYRRAYWQKHPFRGLIDREDECFVLAAARRDRLLVCDYAGPLLIARLHDGNSTPKSVGRTARWSAVDGPLPEGFALA